MTKKWKKLNKGDKIAIIAPSRTFEAEYIAKEAELLRSLGFEPVYDEHFLEQNQDIFANYSIEYRLKMLKKYLEDPGIKALWAHRGGYGASKLINHLLKLEIKAIAKPILGFSDITILHLYQTQILKHATISSQVLKYALSSDNPENHQYVKDMLLGQYQVNYKLTPFKNCNSKVIKGEITGGNLSLIQVTLGTKLQVKTKGKILFLEDTDEEPYKLDRVLHHLKQAGIFDSIKALILGDFDNKDEAKQKSINQVLELFCEDLEVPVYTIDNLGHKGVYRVLPFGTQALIDNAVLKVEPGWE